MLPPPAGRSVPLVGLLVALTACGAAVTPARDGSPETSLPDAPFDAPLDAPRNVVFALDAPPEADALEAPDVEEPDAPEPDVPPLPPAAACEGLPEIALPANRVTEGVHPSVFRYVASGLRAGEDTAHPRCATHASQDGRDVRVRFTAPREGRWRLTARGDGLRAITATRACAAEGGSCVAYGEFSGDFISPTLRLEVQAQRGEGYAVTLDGCAAGAGCSYELAAERAGPLECPERDSADSPCADGGRCVLTPGRFGCYAWAPARAESASVRVDRGERLAVLVVRLRAVPGVAVDTRTQAWLEWLDAGGAVLGDRTLVGVELPRDNVLTVVAQDTAVPEGAVRARVWVQGALGSVEEGMAAAVTAPVEPLARIAEGGACVQGDPASLCAPGHRCVARGGGPAGACTWSAALAISTLRAWRDATSLRFEVSGTRLASQVSQARLTLTTSSGMPILRLTPRAFTQPRYDPARAWFAGSGTRVDLDPGQLRSAALLRASVLDDEGRESASVDAPIEPVRVVGADAPCGPGSACAAGLGCSADAYAPVCVPLVESGACGGFDPARWAPVERGTYAAQGLAVVPSFFVPCAVGPMAGAAALLFVAPRAGRYRFESERTIGLATRADCAMYVCGEESSGVRAAELDLRAGQSVTITGTATPAQVPFTLRARVP